MIIRDRTSGDLAQRLGGPRVPGLQHQRLYSRHDPLFQTQTRKSFPTRDTSPLVIGATGPEI